MHTITNSSEPSVLGIIGEGTGVAAQIVRSCGPDLKAARGEVALILGRGAFSEDIEISFTDRFERALPTAQAEAPASGHNHLATAHVLQAGCKRNRGGRTRVLQYVDRAGASALGTSHGHRQTGQKSLLLWALLAMCSSPDSNAPAGVRDWTHCTPV